MGLAEGRAGALDAEFLAGPPNNLALRVGMWVNLSMPRPDLSRLTPAEKDALILALLDRVAALEAKLGEPPKTPDNSSLPPSRGGKTNRLPRPKRPPHQSQGPG